ncbi:hypothetical protein [Lacipirellula sp.]|uniref:hypothetical protein n=1 Tax=Lacipirellula sp. TaxID=2691419 RepID=UPI003D0A2270
MLSLVAAVAILLGTYAYRADRTRDLNRAVSQLGGVVVYDHEISNGEATKGTPPRVPEAILAIVGEEWLADPKALVLDGVDVKNESLDFLPAYPNISAISLGSTGVTDESLKYISKVERLNVLILFNAKISDAGLKQLAGMRELTYLDLRNTPIGDAGLRELAAVKSLLGINLTGTNTSPEGRREFSQALPKCDVKYVE